jgi:pseudouridine-5'-phosphate glycosidase
MALDVAAEVGAALAAGRPVVALESTIIAHGLPWPENLEIGRALALANARLAAEVAVAFTLGDSSLG